MGTKIFKRVEYTCYYEVNKSILGILSTLKASAAEASGLLKVIGTSLILPRRYERLHESDLPRAGFEVQ